MTNLQKISVIYQQFPDHVFTVGSLAQDTHRLFFEYDNAWLERGLELSPLFLPLQRGLFEHKNRVYGPVFGLFADSLPDGWGMLLLDRQLRKEGIDPATVTILQRLALLGKNTMGALTYHPPIENKESNSTFIDLEKLSENAQAVISGHSRDVLPELQQMGGSPGGARPKVLVGWNKDTDELIAGDKDVPDGFAHWLIKFPMSSKDQFAAELEFIWSEMARVAGLEMPETRLFRDNSENSHFGIKRFDRETNNQRFHVHSFGNLIESDFRIPNCDYTELLKATAYLTRDQREVAKAFRLATFNVLSHNRDDHVKNVAFIQDFATGEWRLTPAFDLTFSAGPGGQHSMTVCGEGVAPGEAELLQLASLVNLDKSLSHQIITDVKNAVSLFPKFAEVHGISKKRRREICQILAL